MPVPEGLIPALLRLTRSNRPFATVAGARERIAQRALRPKGFGPPRLLTRTVTIEVESRDGWPLYTLSPANRVSRGCVVYAHGGGWVHEIAPQHWQLAAQIAGQAQTTVVLPIYPLIPFATSGPVVEAFAGIVRRARDRYGATCLGGDSAGGQIALSTALLLRDEGITLPRTLLIAPALDLSISNPRIPAVLPHDPWLGVDGVRHLCEQWRGDLPYDDPRVSPLAGDLAGLGPLTVYVGTRDILWPDAQLLAQRAREADVAVDLHEQPGLVHVYPLLPTASGRAAREHIVATLRLATRTP